jgi:peroxiredoxin
MRFFTVFLAFFFFFAPSANTIAQSGTQMVFDLKGLQPGMAKLVGMFGDQNYLADSLVIATPGRFTYTRTEPLASGFYTWLLPDQKNFSFLVDQDQRFTMTADLADLPKSARFEGCLNPKLFYETNALQMEVEGNHKALLTQLRNFQPGTPEHAKITNDINVLVADRKQKLEVIYKTYPDAFFTKFKLAGQNPDVKDFYKPNGTFDTLARLIDYRSRFWDNVDFSDERLLRTPVVSNKLKKYIKELTPQHPDSLIVVTDQLIKKAMPHKPYFQYFVNSIGLMHENTKTNVMDGEAVFVHVIKNYITKELAFWDEAKNIDALHKKASEMEASLMGRKGPDVIAPDVDGNMKSIYEKKAQLIVVFMYSPDCDHCREQSPEVKRIYEAWKDKGVDFYGIALNTTDAEWREFLGQQKFGFTNVYDPTNRAIYAKYFVDITPELYVLNQDRIIVAKNLQANQLEDIFKKHLK